MLNYSSNSTLFFAAGAVALIVWLDSRTGRQPARHHAHAGASKPDGAQAVPPSQSQPAEAAPAYSQVEPKQGEAASF